MSDTTTLPTGDIQLIDAALGGDRKALGMLRVLLGPSEEQPIARADGGADRMLLYPRAGSSLRLRDGALIVARLQVHDDGDGVYPRASELIPGIDGMTSRSEVERLLGEPRRRSQLMDLYLFGEHYLRIDFVGGRVDSVSMTIAGIEA